MKKINYWLMAVALLAAPAVLTSCSNDDDKDKTPTYTATLDNLVTNEAGYWIGGVDGPGTDMGYGTKSWYHTYTDGPLAFNLTYSESTSEWGGQTYTSSYWSGFALSSRTETGFNSLTPDQYNNVTGKAHSGNNFIVATLYGENIEVLLEEGLVIESLYYTNSSYTVNSIVNGDDYSGGPFTKEDWLTCTFVGHHADGTKTSVEVDLASNGKYVKEWKKVNLRPLGKIVALDFVMTGSRTGEYGLNTPAYICLDDIKVQIPYDEILK